VYLKNRLPHLALNFTTPYKKLNGDKPDLSKLKVFGSRVSIHNGSRKAKLDDIGSVGTFLTYKNKDKIMYVKDRKSGEEITATHAVFDKAYMAERIQSLPPMAVALQQAGYRQVPTKDLDGDPITLPENHLNIKLLHDDATLPKCGSATAAGLDMYSLETVTIKPKTQHLLQTGVTMEIPKHHFGKLEIQSGLALKHQLDLLAGVIDNDYLGEVKIILRNHGLEDFTVTKDDRIAQMLILPQPSYEVHAVDSLTTMTERGTQGFGSTGLRDAPITPNPVTTTPSQGSTTPAEKPTAIPNRIPPDKPDKQQNNTIMPSPISPEPSDNSHMNEINAAQPHSYHIIPPDTIRHVEADLDYYPFCSMDISSDPHIDKIEIKLGTAGSHPTKGLNK
jgi:dUTP pyrophosphatase